MLQQQMHRMVQGYNQRFGEPNHIDNYYGNLTRTLYLDERLKSTPNGERLTQVYKMKLAGFKAAETKAGKAFMKVSRDMKKLSKKQDQPRQLLPPLVPASPSESTVSSLSTVSTTAGVSTTSRVSRPAKMKAINVPNFNSNTMARSDDTLSPLSMISDLGPTSIIIYN